MCQLIVIKNKLPSEDFLKGEAFFNKDGAGIAWIDGDKVRWEKNVCTDDIIRLCCTIKRMPIVVHFRFATVGGGKPELCHPFPISKEVSTVVSGSANRVLFHNGHWQEWKEVCFNKTITSNNKIPKGPWSDSRAIAWLCALKGERILNFMGGKYAVLSKKGVNMYGEFYEKDGYYVSSWTAAGYTGYTYNAGAKATTQYEQQNWWKTPAETDESVY